MRKITIEIPEWEDVPLSFKDNPDFLLVFHEYMEHRKKIKKPLTAYSQVLHLKKIVKNRWGLEATIHHINHSIEAGWQGIFEDKEYREKSGGIVY